MPLKALKQQRPGHLYPLHRVSARRWDIIAYPPEEILIRPCAPLKSVCFGPFINLTSHFHFDLAGRPISVILKSHYHLTRASHSLLGLGEYRGKSTINYTARGDFLNQMMSVARWPRHFLGS
jgi:hypothetical protein